MTRVRFAPDEFPRSLLAAAVLTLVWSVTPVLASDVDRLGDFCPIDIHGYLTGQPAPQPPALFHRPAEVGVDAPVALDSQNQPVAPEPPALPEDATEGATLITSPQTEPAADPFAETPADPEEISPEATEDAAVSSKEPNKIEDVPLAKEIATDERCAERILIEEDVLEDDEVPVIVEVTIAHDDAPVVAPKPHIQADVDAPVIAPKPGTETLVDLPEPAVPAEQEVDEPIVVEIAQPAAPVATDIPADSDAPVVAPLPVDVAELADAPVVAPVPEPQPLWPVGSATVEPIDLDSPVRAEQPRAPQRLASPSEPEQASNEDLRVFLRESVFPALRRVYNQAAAIWDESTQRR